MITLRAITLEDASAVHRIAADREVARTLGGMPSDGLEGWRRRISESPLDSNALIGAFESSSERIESLVGIGSLVGYPRARQRHVARVWVAVDPRAFRRGIGAQLLGALCDAADRWWGYVRIEADANADDFAARALGARFGFAVELYKRGERVCDGEWVDGVEMARLRPGFVSASEVGDAAPVPARGAHLGDAISIRPIRVDDAAAMALLHQTESVMEGTFQTPFQSEREWRLRLSGNSEAMRVLVAVAAGRVVGSIGLFGASSPRRAHAATLGLSVHPDAQGRGVGDAMMVAALDLADRWMALRRVQLEAYADNARGQALYRKHGFEVEGTQRYAAYRRGTHVDAVVMARLRR